MISAAGGGSACDQQGCALGPGTPKPPSAPPPVAELARGKALSYAGRAQNANLCRQVRVDSLNKRLGWLQGELGAHHLQPGDGACTAHAPRSRISRRCSPPPCYRCLGGGRMLSCRARGARTWLMALTPLSVRAERDHLICGGATGAGVGGLTGALPCYRVGAQCRAPLCWHQSQHMSRAAL